MNSPEAIYLNRLSKFTARYDSLKRRINRISNFRFIVFGLMVAADIFLYRSGHLLAMAVCSITGIAVFIALVFYHESLYKLLNHVESLLQINSRCLNRLHDKWNSHDDTGSVFVNKEHAFTSDLDVFGPDSVFQWITGANTFSGRAAVARVLSMKPDEIHLIQERQTAIAELAPMVDFRHTLQAYSKNECMDRNDEPILSWLESSESLFKSNTVNSMLYIFPWFINIAAFTAFVFKVPGIGSLLYLLSFCLSLVWRTRIMKIMNAFEKRSDILNTYSRVIELIQSEKFHSPLLQKLQKEFTGEYKESAFIALKKLASQVTASHVRYSGIGAFIFNMLFIWDIQCVLRMERWKKHHGKSVRKWIVAIGEIEMLSTLSQIHFENPGWCFPVISKDTETVVAKDIGHPLLWSKKRVCNDFQIAGGVAVSVITGSNMSGKTTFLRTVGVNMILAFAGAPVCAETFTCFPVNLYTSMRIHDDLRSNVSSFYAELIRVKKIVDAIDSGEKVFFLLDELFRGTNSRDRHDGAIAVLRVLSSGGANGLISTHDLELANLEKLDSEKFKNYHFSERVTETDITFDYQLQDGPTNSRNALAMIRLAGIPIM